MITAAPAHLQPRAILHALLLGAMSGHIHLGRDAFVEMLVPRDTPERAEKVMAAYETLLDDLEPLIVAEIVDRTALESGLVVYALSSGFMAMLTSGAVGAALVAAGLEDALPVAPEAGPVAPIRACLYCDETGRHWAANEICTNRPSRSLMSRSSRSRGRTRTPRRHGSAWLPFEHAQERIPGIGRWRGDAHRNRWMLSFSK